MLDIMIPFSPAANKGAFAFEIDREDLRKDSLKLTIAAHELESYREQFPGLRIIGTSITIDLSDMATNLEEAFLFNKYPTYPQYDSMMHYFAETYPSICRIDTFGLSAQGRLLLAVKISDNVMEEEDEPSFLYTSTMHGDELVGYILCLRFIHHLLSGYGSDIEIDRIINDVELYINPLSNPDGTYFPDNDMNVSASVRSNVNGVNLNRNYPDPGYGSPDDTTGRQPETKAMMEYMYRIKPNLSANIHSGAEVVNYPWDHKIARHPDDDWFQLISRDYADDAHAVEPTYLNQYEDGITNGYDWYQIRGGRQDYVNYYLHGREVTLELSAIKKLESENLEAHWNYNKRSMLNLVNQARYGIHGNVSGSQTGQPLEAKIWIPGHDNDSSWVQSDSVSGNFYRYLKEGVYDLIVEAEGYITDTIQAVEVLDYQKTPLLVKLDSLGTYLPASGTARLRLYPNPATENILVSLPMPLPANAIASLVDMSGRLILQADVPRGSERFEMDLRGIDSGIYLLQLSGNGISITPGILVRQ